MPVRAALPSPRASRRMPGAWPTRRAWRCPRSHPAGAAPAARTPRRKGSWGRERGETVHLVVRRAGPIPQVGGHGDLPEPLGHAYPGQRRAPSGARMELDLGPLGRPHEGARPALEAVPQPDARVSASGRLRVDGDVAGLQAHGAGSRQRPLHAGPNPRPGSPRGEQEHPGGGLSPEVRFCTARPIMGPPSTALTAASVAAQVVEQVRKQVPPGEQVGSTSPSVSGHGDTPREQGRPGPRLVHGTQVPTSAPPATWRAAARGTLRPVSAR
jgi:hypothetical protein